MHISSHPPSYLRIESIFVELEAYVFVAALHTEVGVSASDYHFWIRACDARAAVRYGGSL